MCLKHIFLTFPCLPVLRRKCFDSDNITFEVASPHAAIPALTHELLKLKTSQVELEIGQFLFLGSRGRILDSIIISTFVQVHKNQRRAREKNDEHHHNNCNDDGFVRLPFVII